jgi:hypothetical protein
MAPAASTGAIPASAQPSFVTIKTPKGVSFQVDAKYAPNFQGFVNDLEGSGYNIRSASGVANRDVAGTNVPSAHATGDAIDINPDTNPLGSKGDLPANVAQLAQKYGLGWGGAWKSKSDPMHFSMAQNEGGSANPYGQPEPAGLSADEKAKWEALQPAPPTTAAGETSGTGKQFTSNGQNMTAAQEAYYAQRAAQPGGLDMSPGMEGTAGMPYALQRGRPIPATPGAHYVDFDGKEHVVPGGVLGALKSFGAGALQGVGPDLVASGNKLTGGGLAVGDPMAGALAQTQGGPSIFDTAQAGTQGLTQQARDYHFAHLGDVAAQGGRFVGQAIPATAAAAAVPEIALPGRAATGVGGVLANVGSKVLTNAARGAAATAPTVGANATPVGEQLATGAAAGVIAPPLIKGALKAGGMAAGLGGAVSPEVKALADRAINEYDIPLRGSQIAGIDNPSLAVKDSNLINAPGSGFAKNDRAQRQAFTRAVAGTFGADAEKITPAVMNQARSDLGAKFDAFAQGHSVQDVDGLQTRLGGIIHDAQQVMPAGEVAPLLNQVQNIGDVATRDAAGNRTITGDAYQALVSKGSPLDRAMQSGDSNVRYYAHQIRDALDDGIMQSASPGEIADFRNTRLQYKNLMTVKGLAAKAGVTGEISPTQLQGVVNRSFDDRAFHGAGPLGELADIGQTFLKPPPNSFTAQRAAEIAGRNWLPATLASAAAGEYGILSHPAIAAKLAAGALAAKGMGYGVNALEGLRYGQAAGALAIRQPGNFGGALAGVGNLVRPTEVPLSALGGNYEFNTPGSVAQRASSYLPKVN